MDYRPDAKSLNEEPRAERRFFTSVAKTIATAGLLVGILSVVLGLVATVTEALNNGGILFMTGLVLVVMSAVLGVLSEISLSLARIRAELSRGS